MSNENVRELVKHFEELKEEGANSEGLHELDGKTFSREEVEEFLKQVGGVEKE